MASGPASGTEPRGDSSPIRLRVALFEEEGTKFLRERRPIRLVRPAPSRRAGEDDPEAAQAEGIGRHAGEGAPPCPVDPFDGDEAVPAWLPYNAFIRHHTLRRLAISPTEPIQAAAPDVALRAESPRTTRRPSPAPWRFPGCRPIHLSREDIIDYEGRLEFWDAELETAWVMEPTSPYHESPSQILAALVDRIAAVRGSPIRCFGTMDLLLRDEAGERRRILQADQAVYLHPVEANLPGKEAMVIGEHAYPDVVMEVDYSTDARPSKLGLYASWEFPEVWLDVPEERPRSRVPGLTICLLDGGAYRVVGESRAFPGWRAEEIHVALNERVSSEATCAVLERVGLALGAREGTGPDDNPLLRSQRRQGYEQGRSRGQVEGRAEGRAEGPAEGRVEARAEGRPEGRGEARLGMVRRMLRSRGVRVSDGFPAGVLSECSEDTIVAAALACESEADFLARLQGSSPRS